MAAVGHRQQGDEAPVSNSTRSAPGGNGNASSVSLPRAEPAKPPARVKVIKFSRVSKRFTLHHERPNSFQEWVVNLFGIRNPSRRGVHMPRPANEEFWALQDVNFSIYKGEAVGIVGENGSGKSTTLKLVSRILEPTSGSVSVKGKVSALLELGTGFHPELTGRENIFLNGSLLGISRREMQRRYDKIVDFAEIEEFIDTPIKHYSSGMVMRLAFAVAINVDPDILLTDEVLAVGDEAFQRKCLEYIAELRKRGVTIVYVSHALDSVRALCSRAIWLDHGRVVADGRAGEVIDRYLTYENERHAARVRFDSLGEGTAPLDRPEPMAPIEEPDEDEHVETLKVEDATSQPKSTHVARISDVTFVNGDGEEIGLAQTGEPFTIRIHYWAGEKIEDPVFGLALYTENGTHVNGPNTRFAGLTIPHVEGTGYVDYTIDELPLLAGTYYITVAMTDADMAQTFDHQHRAYSFVVQPTPGLAERFGLLNMPARWSHTPGSDGQAPSSD